MKLVFDLGGHEQRASRRNRFILIACLESAFAADHVVHLVFMMWTLGIDRSHREDVQTGAQSWHAQEFPVLLSALRTSVVDLVDPAEPGFLERGLQARIPPNTSSVNCGTRLCACRF